MRNNLRTTIAALGLGLGIAVMSGCAPAVDTAGTNSPAAETSKTSQAAKPFEDLPADDSDSSADANNELNEGTPSEPIAKVKRVIDGNTIALEPTATLPANNAKQDEHVVVLRGIDAPELDAKDATKSECGAQEAADNLGELLGVSDESSSDTRVQLAFDKNAEQLDASGHSLAYVEMASGPDRLFDDVAKTMVREGHAVASDSKEGPRPENTMIYKKAEQQAESSKMGLWETCDDFGQD